MQSKITLLLVVVCVAETILASPIDDAIKELRPKVEAAKKKINEALQENDQKLAEAHKVINDETHPADREIHKQLEDLRKTVHDAVVNAKKNNTNIRSCVKDEIKSRIELNLHNHGINSCKRNRKFHEVAHKLGELRRLKHTVGVSIKACLKNHSSDADILKKCVESKLDVDEKIETAISKIDEDLKTAEKQVSACVKKTLEKVKPALEQIKKDFNDCVEKA